MSERLSTGEVVESLRAAAALRSAGRFGEAVALLEDALAHHADAWPLWHDLGLAHAADGRPDEAVEAYREAVRRGGDGVAAVWVNLGNALRSSGSRDAATEAYRRAIAGEPGLAPAHYNLHAAVYEDAAPGPAMDALQRAWSLRPDHPDTRFYLGALLALHEAAGDRLLEGLPEGCDFLRASLAFVQAHRDATTRLFADTFETLRFAVGAAPASGLVAELGVRRGTSLRFLAKRVERIHGFDSFEGLPEGWGEQAPGLYSAAGALPSVPDNATLHPGWFAEVLPGFVEAQRGQPLRLVNVDCDLYTSTREGLEALAPLVVDGTVLVFDEYLCNPGWEQEEHRAFVEVAERHGWRYRYLAFSLFTKQAVVRIGGSSIGP